MRNISIPKALILLTLLASLFYSGCSENLIGETQVNKPPSVWLSSGPPEGSVEKYFVHFYWGGWDPDGKIERYQFVITDNPRGGLIINDALFKAFEDTVGTYFFQPWEELHNRPAGMPAKTPIWKGRVMIHKPDQDHPAPYFCDQDGFEVQPDSKGVIRPVIAPAKKVWNGITMYGKSVIPNDSSFVFSADIQADTNSTEWIQEFRRTHTFFIRAVDNKGGVTANKGVAYRSFTARTLSPVVRIKIPSETKPFNPALVPPIARFEWTAKDYIDNLVRTQDPDSVRWVLIPYIDNDFDKTLEFVQHMPDSGWTSTKLSPKWPSGWIPYNAPGDSGKFADSYHMELGTEYLFAVQAKDEAGAVTAVFDEAHNVRRILPSPRTTGPILYVYNKFIGTAASASVKTPIIIFDLPEGVPLTFRIKAEAKHYGGVVAGYRYGWDILNLNEDKDWDISYTPFLGGSEAWTPPRSFYFGTHTFYAEVKDNSGFKSRVGVRINVIPFTMDRSLLLVDDFEDNELGIVGTRGAAPSEEEHDAFWIEMLDNVSGFEPSQDMVQVGQAAKLPITKLASYKAVIWDVRGSFIQMISLSQLLYSLIRFQNPNAETTSGKIQPNLLALYMAAGGHLLICGQQPLQLGLNRSYFLPHSILYPVITLYESGGDQGGASGNYREGPIGESGFLYNEYCLDVLDVSYNGFSFRREFCKVDRRDYSNGAREIYRDDTNDYDGYSFPESFTLSSIVTQPGFHYETKGYESEIYNPRYFTNCDTAIVTYKNHPRDCFEPMLRQRTANPSSKVNNAILAYWTSKFANVIPKQGVPARSAVWGFEPYFFEHDKVKEALEVILFGEWKLTPKF